MTHASSGGLIYDFPEAICTYQPFLISQREATTMTTPFRISIPTMGVLLSILTGACVPQQSVAPTSVGQPSERATFAKVSMPNTEVRQLKSSATGRDYDIYVRLPDQYAQDKAKKYPVL